MSADINELAGYLIPNCYNALAYHLTFSSLICCVWRLLLLSVYFEVFSTAGILSGNSSHLSRFRVLCARCLGLCGVCCVKGCIDNTQKLLLSYSEARSDECLLKQALRKE